jgi:hypothetical protein
VPWPDCFFRIMPLTSQSGSGLKCCGRVIEQDSTSLGGSGHAKARYRFLLLYQIKNTRPVGRISAMLVALFYLGWGLSRLHDAIVFRTAETKAFGSAEPPHWSFHCGFCPALAIGAFVGHVGVIYYSRKLYHWASGAHRHSA